MGGKYIREIALKSVLLCFTRARLFCFPGAHGAHAASIWHWCAHFLKPTPRAQHTKKRALTLTRANTRTHTRYAHSPAPRANRDHSQGTRARPRNTRAFVACTYFTPPLLEPVVVPYFLADTSKGEAGGQEVAGGKERRKAVEEGASAGGWG